MQSTLGLAERVSTISVSSTMKVAADADRLRREGADVVDFGAGEPDFPTPENIKQAGNAAIKANFTKYTAAGGTLELRQAICERHAQGLRHELFAFRMHRDRGRKARHLQPRPSGGEPGRRGNHTGPVLGHLQRRHELHGR